jgi:hypothetical protein
MKWQNIMEWKFWVLHVLLDEMTDWLTGLG